MLTDLILETCVVNVAITVLWEIDCIEKLKTHIQFFHLFI